jgi:hypothetical protein
MGFPKFHLLRSIKANKQIPANAETVDLVLSANMYANSAIHAEVRTIISPKYPHLENKRII